MNRTLLRFVALLAQAREHLRPDKVTIVSAGAGAAVEV